MEEIPLGNIDHFQFIELVARNDVRPERPDDEDDEGSTPQLTDAVWELAEQCWVKDPKQRPTAGALCDTIIQLLESQDIKPAQELSPVNVPISPGGSLDSPRALPTSNSTSTSPTSSNILPAFTKPPQDEAATLMHSAPLIDLRDDAEVFYDRNPFAADSSAPSSVSPTTEATTTSKNPFRQLIQVPLPPGGVQVLSEVTHLGSIEPSTSPELLPKGPIPPGWEARRTAGMTTLDVPRSIPYRSV